jgi:hypothetical protein
MSRICDSGRGSGTARRRKPCAGRRARTVPSADRYLPAVPGDDNADQGAPGTRTGKAALAAVGEWCRAVNAHIARASTNSGGCHCPASPVVTESVGSQLRRGGLANRDAISPYKYDNSWL